MQDSSDERRREIEGATAREDRGAAATTRPASTAVEPLEGADAAEEVDDAVWTAFHETRFDVDRSRNYHAMFERHYGSWHRRIRLFSLAFASAAAATLLGDAAFGGWAALAVTVLQLLDNQYRLSEQAAKHSGLRKQYAALYAGLMRHQDDLLAGGLAPVREWQSRYEAVYAGADEHGLMEVANARAHNAAVRAMDGPEEEMFAISPAQYALACYVDLRPGRLKKRKLVEPPDPLGKRALDWFMAD